MKRQRFPIYESIAQCVSELGAPMALVKRAKREGCPAFLSGNRIDSALLIPWLFAMLLKSSKTELLDGQQEKAKLDKARRLEQERENAIAEGELHTLAQVEEALWENGLANVRQAWTSYPKTTGLKLRSILETAGVAPAVIQQAVETAVSGVTDPLEKLRAMLPKEKAE